MEKLCAGVVVFGRPYNALAKVANMGIPAKFASKGYYTIPVDFLPYKEKELKSNMYWAMGRIILKGGKIVKESEKLFGVYISNFSCGPDSFVIGDFRKIPYQNNSFKLVVFDPPHLVKAGEKSWLRLKYGKLDTNMWKSDIEIGFKECMRVLDKYGILVFKWNEEQIKLKEILDVIKFKPLFGNKRAKTHWLLFMKT